MRERQREIKKKESPSAHISEFHSSVNFQYFKKCYHYYRVGTQRKVLRVLKVNPIVVVAGSTAWRRIFQGHLIFL